VQIYLISWPIHLQTKILNHTTLLRWLFYKVQSKNANILKRKTQPPRNKRQSYNPRDAWAPRPQLCKAKAEADEVRLREVRASAPARSLAETETKHHRLPKKKNPRFRRTPILLPNPSSSQSPPPHFPIPPVSGCPRPAGPRGGGSSGLPAGEHAPMEPRVANKFRLGRKLGSGSFGEIFLGSCCRFPPRLNVAARCESSRLFFLSPVVLMVCLFVWCCCCRYSRADERGGRD
jgi:hypothetical protein